jgi:hypothetical protein
MKTVGMFRAFVEVFFFKVFYFFCFSSSFFSFGLFYSLNSMHMILSSVSILSPSKNALSKPGKGANVSWY